MPVKLAVVIALLGLGVVLNLITLNVIAVVIGVLLIVFLVLASHTARGIAIILTYLAIAGQIWAFVQALDAFGSAGAIPALVWLIVAFGLAQSVFTLWALTRDDVIEWMDARAGGAPVKKRLEDGDGPSLGSRR